MKWLIGFAWLMLATGAFAQSTPRMMTFAELRQELVRTPQQLVVVNFWATWCRPCVAELPYFEQLRTAYADSGVRVVLVALDDPDLFSSTFAQFVQRKGLKSDVVLMRDTDLNTWVAQIAPAWDGVIPATMLVRNGNLTPESLNLQTRSFTYDELVALVRPHLPLTARP
jgi:thiol-disulfide isomerase/thioredoxin